ncbi:hypothetical protein DFP73DRAFT_373428 [Morchella snyderi]|nr:hypothetical protein DFP73DRAFT_373428 [Morchella snyderi]
MSTASIKKGHSRSWSLRSKKNKDETRLSSLPPAKQKKMTKNVDPTRAITEDEPFQVNQSTNQYKSLSQLKFKDRFGNDITDPDLTNPTRHRWESPLETIRGFEAAIDKDERRGSYVERTSSNAGAGYSSDTVDSVDGNSWRHNRYPQQTGYYQTTTGPRGRPPPDSLHYTGRSGYSETPRSAVDGYGESEMGYGNMNRKRSPGSNASHGYNGYNGYNNPHPQERMGRPLRRQTYESQNYDAPPNQPDVYHNQAVNGGGESPVNPGSSSSGAGSDGPGGYIREPALPPPQPSFGFRDQAMFESSQQITPFENFSPSGSAPSQMPQSMPTSPSTVRKPIPLSSPAPAPAPQPVKQEEKKRRSWFKRRSSKD